MKTVFLNIALLLTFSSVLYANKKGKDSIPLGKNPIFVQVQYAGNLGLMSLGMGKSFFNENLSVCFIYGYLPKQVNGAEVHTLALKTAVNCFNLKIKKSSKLSGYLGTALLRGFTQNTFIELPSHYPEDYYQPNAYHFSFFSGMKYSFRNDKYKILNRSSGYIEIGTLDYQIWYDINNDFIDFSNIWNVSFGFSYRIN